MLSTSVPKRGFVGNGASQRIQPAEHFLVLPVPFFSSDNVLKVELQACDGLRRWRSDFESMIVAAPLADDAFLARNPGIAWVAVEEVASY